MARPPSHGISRRAALRYAVHLVTGGAALGVLAACGGTATTAGSATAATTAPATASAAAPASSAATSRAAATSTTRAASTATASSAAATSSAASSSAAPSASVSAPAGQGTTLYYQNWDDLTQYKDSYGAWYRWAFDTFQQQHPGVTIQYVLTPFGNIVEKVIAGVAAGTPVDGTVCSILHGRDLYDKHALMALDAYIDRTPELAPGGYFDVANFYRSSQGKYYALSIYADVSMIGVNSRMLRDASLDPKAADVKTWDDLLHYSERLTKTDASGKLTQLGFPYNLPGLEEWATWSYANGGEIQDAEVTKALFDSTQVADMLRYRATQYQRFGVNRSPDLKGDLFKVEKEAMEHTSTSLQVAVSGGTYVPKGFEYWFIPTPKGPDGAGPGAAFWVNMVATPTGAKHPDLSFDLLRTIAGPDGLAQMFQDAKIYPALKSFYQTPTFTKAVAADPVLAVPPQVFPQGKTYPFFRRYNDVSKVLTPLVQDAVAGKRDVQQALKDGVQQVNAILSK